MYDIFITGVDIPCKSDLQKLNSKKKISRREYKRISENLAKHNLNNCSRQSVSILPASVSSSSLSSSTASSSFASSSSSSLSTQQPSPSTEPSRLNEILKTYVLPPRSLSRPSRPPPIRPSGRAADCNISVSSHLSAAGDASKPASKPPSKNSIAPPNPAASSALSSSSSPSLPAQPSQTSSSSTDLKNNIRDDSKHSHSARSSSSSSSFIKMIGLAFSGSPRPVDLSSFLDPPEDDPLVKTQDDDVTIDQTQTKVQEESSTSPTVSGSEPCKSKSDSPSQVLFRRNSKGNANIIQCYICEYQTFFMSSYMSHLRNHQETSMFKCDLCNFSDDNSGKVLTHKINDHKGLNIIGI